MEGGGFPRPEVWQEFEIDESSSSDARRAGGASEGRASEEAADVQRERPAGPSRRVTGAALF